jgi:hypothetical protein
VRDRESGNFNNMIGVGMCRGGIADAIAIVMVLLAMIVEGVVIVVVGHRRKCVRGSSGLGMGVDQAAIPRSEVNVFVRMEDVGVSRLVVKEVGR